MANRQVSDLDLKVVAASSWAMALGTIFFVSSVLQIIGYLPGDIGWVNFAVAVATIGADRYFEPPFCAGGTGA